MRKFQLQKHINLFNWLGETNAFGYDRCFLPPSFIYPFQSGAANFGIYPLGVLKPTFCGTRISPLEQDIQCCTCAFMWDQACTSTHMSLHQRTGISLMCGKKKKHQQNPHRRHATEPAMQHVDMITPQTATRVIDWSLTTFLKTLSVRSKTTRSNIAPSELHSPSIHLPFFSLINM